MLIDKVAENGESTQRQYALRDRAIASGWPTERIHVIDCDLGKSGSSAATRDGFQELVSEVALNKAGIVMGLEVSRLARNSADWHRLLELCALTATLIAASWRSVRLSDWCIGPRGHSTLTPTLRCKQLFAWCLIRSTA